MEKFEITKNVAEFESLEDVFLGCTILEENTIPEKLESFETLEDAKEALKGYSSDWRKVGNVYIVTEFYVQENVFDENGIWSDCGDIWATAPYSQEIGRAWGISFSYTDSDGEEQSDSITVVYPSDSSASRVMEGVGAALAVEIDEPRARYQAVLSVVDRGLTDEEITDQEKLTEKVNDFFQSL